MMDMLMALVRFAIRIHVKSERKVTCCGKIDKMLLACNCSL